MNLREPLDHEASRAHEAHCALEAYEPRERVRGRPVDGLDLWVRPDEQCVALTRDYRLVQRTTGHRYSVDDMLVAHLACQRSEEPRRVLDLGCGIGSVLLTLAWAYPDAELVGVEAQVEHASLARRNLVLNGCETRARVFDGDLRDTSLLHHLGAFDLVTATPPYFSPEASTVSSDKQRAYAYWEFRGGALVSRHIIFPEPSFDEISSLNDREYKHLIFSTTLR